MLKSRKPSFGLLIPSAIDQRSSNWERIRNKSSETVEFLGGVGESEAVNMLDSPFAVNPVTPFKPDPTRYSDGSWRVFYSAIEPETAQEEKAYWCRRSLVADSSGPRQFHFREFVVGLAEMDMTSGPNMLIGDFCYRSAKPVDEPLNNLPS